MSLSWFNYFDVPLGVTLHEVTGVQPAAGEDGRRGGGIAGNNRRTLPGRPLASSPLTAPSRISPVTGSATATTTCGYGLPE